VKVVYLLEVNLLVALLWPEHSFYDIAQEWFQTKGRHGWATCPITQAGFVRITSNPAFSRDAASPQEAASVLRESMRHPHHNFWPDSIGFAEATALFDAQIVGHKQITDAYLLGLAIHNGGKLATLDRSITSLLPPSSPHLRSIELLG